MYFWWYFEIYLLISDIDTQLSTLLGSSPEVVFKHLLDSLISRSNTSLHLHTGAGSCTHGFSSTTLVYTLEHVLHHYCPHPTVLSWRERERVKWSTFIFVSEHLKVIVNMNIRDMTAWLDCFNMDMIHQRLMEQENVLPDEFLSAMSISLSQ